MAQQGHDGEAARYVSLAAEYARKIRTGELPATTQLPSYGEIARKHGVSEIVVRKALELLKNQGLIRSERRRGIFVTDQPNLVRISPERQMEDPEDTYGHETDREVQIERERAEVPAPEHVAEAFAVEMGEPVIWTKVRASEAGRPISISDSYQPLGVLDTSTAETLVETVADRLPTPDHAAWLRTPAGELVKTVHQRYTAGDGRVVMLSDISYPRNRYDSFVFRMSLTADS
ncbi:GntR family transcriptional regulator [Nocardia jiangxiensis]|uniref:GntR family transcriptional regulator n=1 Tax=Nocardia jiangxiensis TaxID=282685 RepID=UPI00068753AE|nr:GntR family transcriptional regulator [Nocardia jiangxiensis]